MVCSNDFDERLCMVLCSAHVAGCEMARREIAAWFPNSHPQDFGVFTSLNKFTNHWLCALADGLELNDL